MNSHTPFYASDDTLQALYRCDTQEEITGLIEHTTVSEVLDGYFSHREVKAENGRQMSVMHVRHVHVTGLRYIGKESNELQALVFTQVKCY